MPRGLFVVLLCCCSGSPEEVGEDTIDRCADSIDNDHDGLVDCDDPRCGVFPRCQREDDPCGGRCEEPLVCSAESCVHPDVDEDGDGYPAISDCDDRDPMIVPGTTRPCSTACGEGVETCLGGTWQACTAPEECDCEPGATRDEGCGRCGIATRTCEASGVWGAASVCRDEGLCAAGARELDACSVCTQRSRTCSDDCTWGEYGECEPMGECEVGASEVEGCGNCGLRSRICTNQCLWGSWGECVDEGCSPAEQQSRECGMCGSQSRTCRKDCTWSTWTGCANEGECFVGESDEQTCGSCGTRSRICGDDCTWGDWSSCGGEGSCAPGSNREIACGECGNRAEICWDDCEWASSGSCDNTPARSCDDGDPCTTDTCGSDGDCDYAGCGASMICCDDGCQECCDTRDCLGLLPGVCRDWLCSDGVCTTVLEAAGTDPENECAGACDCTAQGVCEPGPCADQ